jgi:hypothetical protein
MEVGMNRAGAEQPGPSGEKLEQEPVQKLDKTSSGSDAAGAAPDAGNPTLEPLMTPEALSVQVERFSRLSSDMAKLLSELSQEAKKSLDQLNGIRLAVDLKKKELKTLNESAASLKQLIEDHRLQRENLDRLMEGQRRVWEEEKTRRAQQEREYLEDLKIQRQREEEEYRHMWAVEQLKAQQKLEEELRTIQQKSLEKQQALERDCLQREQTLKEKELEWIQLIQELEQFMSRLARHAQSPSAVHAELHTKEPSMQSDFAVLGSSLADSEDASKDQSLIQDRPLSPIFGNALTDEPKPSLSSLKEMLLSQGRRIESLNAELSAKRESAPLKFSPKKDPK